MPSKRNKTIRVTSTDFEKYRKSLLILKEPFKNIFDITNNIINQNTFEALTFFPPKSVDLLIVDPPYNLSKNFGTIQFKKQEFKEYNQYLERWISLCVPLLKPTASVYVCGDWKTSLSLFLVLSKYFFIQNRITWQREKGRGAKKNFKNNHEDIWFCTVHAKEYTFHVDQIKLRRKVVAPYKKNGVPKDWNFTIDGNFRDTYPSNLWDDITIPYWSMSENTEHPTQKPEKLLAKLILASSNPKDIILDPFLGSGTTTVVAKKLGRHYIGIEQDLEYCILSKKRLEQTNLGNRIQGYSDNIFWERNSLQYQK